MTYIEEYNRRYIIKRQTDTGSVVIQISRQCLEQILARQREFKGKRAKLRKGILKMKSSDDGREMSFQMLRETCWIPPARNGEYN